MEPIPIHAIRRDPVRITNMILAPGEPPPVPIDPCPECLAAGQPHTVSRTIDRVETRGGTPTIFDATGAAHIHDNTQETQVMTCSSGHKWASRYVIRCPLCGWVIDDDMNP